MNRRGSFASLLGGIVCLWAGRTSVASAAERKRHRAVFDLSADSTDRWEAALRSVENLRQIFGAEEVEAVLVVHEKAYPLLQKTNTGMEAQLRA